MTMEPVKNVHIDAKDVSQPLETVKFARLTESMPQPVTAQEVTMMTDLNHNVQNVTVNATPVNLLVDV